MADTITIICPECEKAIKAPADVIGKKIRCKGCGETFTAKASKEASKGIKPAKDKPADKKKPAKDQPEEEEGGAYGLIEEYLGARCPECAEKMGDEDVICLACGYSTITRTKPQVKKVREITGGDIFLHLLPGILCATAGLTLLSCVVSFWIEVLFFYEMPEEIRSDRFYRSSTYCCFVWPTIFQIWLIYKATRFAIRRLIYNNKPAEVEEQWGEKD